MVVLEECEGYKKLLAAVQYDLSRSQAHDYQKKLDWVVSRANHYAEKTGLNSCDILNHWEQYRDYWYMNYYQDCNQPLMGEKVLVFDTVAQIQEMAKQGFRCPSCNGISKSPSNCDTGIKIKKAVCDWKAYGLFRTMGKGVHIFCKENFVLMEVFMPVAYEKAGV